MAFDVTSRYQLDDSGITASRKSVAAVPYTTYRVISGDTMLNLAARLLGNDRRWWEIADLNPQVKFPEDLVVGNLLRIPR